MTAFSLGTVWEETIAFLRREWALLAPVGLAVFGPAQLLLLLAMSGAADPKAAADAVPSGQTLLLLPAALVIVFGNMAVASIVLAPGTSVGEGLGRAVKSIPRALGVLLLLSLGFFLMVLIIVIAATLGVITFGANARSPAMANPLAFLIALPMMVLVVRMLLLAPVLAMEPLRPVEAIRRIWSLSANNVVRFATIWILTVFLSVLAAMIEQVVIGSVFKLIRFAVNADELLGIVQALINAAIGALLSMGIAVYLALVYRKLTAA